MKTTLTHTCLAALAAACSMATAAETAYTTPVGYVTQTLPANTFSLVGFNVTTPRLVTGQLTAVAGAVLSDTNNNFTTALPVGQMCVVEITSGTAAGTIQEFTTRTIDSITLPAAVAGIAAGDKYSIRAVPSLQSTFAPPVLGASFFASTADKVWVPTGDGNYTRYWYKANAPIGWHTTTTSANDTGLVTGDIPLVFIDGILIQKGSTTTDLTLSGEVKTTTSSALIVQGFNPITITAPVGLTLFSSNLNLSIDASFFVSTADNIWVPQGNGTYIRYWYKANAPIGWHTTTTGGNDTGLVTVDPPLQGAILIQRKSPTPAVVKIAVPVSYSNL